MSWRKISMGLPTPESPPEIFLSWKIRDRLLTSLHRPLVMGILNVTHDSFYEASRFPRVDEAVARAIKMAEDGADILDIGGLSSRPGSLPIPWEEEAERVIPVIERVSVLNPIPISVDTYRSEVADLAMKAGAHIVNDISALQLDPSMARVVIRYGAGLVMMHMRGVPATMQSDTDYDDVLGEIKKSLKRCLSTALRLGIQKEQMIIDPGIGFGKSTDQNLDIIRSLEGFHSLGYPILLGASRKSFIGHVLNREIKDRLAGSLAIAAVGMLKKVFVLRVHDVCETVDLLKMLELVYLNTSREDSNLP